MSSTECVICLVKFNSLSVNTHITECNHKFHIKCFEKIKTPSCPCCRGYIKFTDKQNKKIFISNYKAELKDTQTRYCILKRNIDVKMKYNTAEINKLKAELNMLNSKFMQCMNINIDLNMDIYTFEFNVDKFSRGIKTVRSELVSMIHASRTYINESKEELDNLNSEICNIKSSIRVLNSR